MRIPGVMVVGTDTEVGKTFLSCRLLERLHRDGIQVGAYKPVASGALSVEQSDPYLLWNASGRLGKLSDVNPQSFHAAVAPPVSAEVEGKQVDEALMVSGALAWEDRCDFLLVEGAGGLMSPLSWTLTNADLAQALRLPLVLVAPNKLGVVNQVLTSLMAAGAKGLEVRYVFLNDTLPSTSDSSISTNNRLLHAFLEKTVDVPPKVVHWRYNHFQSEPNITSEDLIRECSRPLRSSD